MKKAPFLFFSIFFTINAFALSSVYTIDNNTKIRSERSDKTDTNIIKVLTKDQKLQRSTMHYSGWSMVSIDDLSGWVLSEKLTDKPPVVKIKKPSPDLVKKIENLKKENAKLSSEMLDMKALLTFDNEKLKVENTALKQQVLELSNKLKSLTLVDKKTTDTSTNKTKKNTTQATPSNKAPVNNKQESDANKTSFFNININWTYTGIAILFVISLFVAIMFNNSRRRNSDLNTIRRY